MRIGRNGGRRGERFLNVTDVFPKRNVKATGDISETLLMFVLDVVKGKKQTIVCVSMSYPAINSTKSISGIPMDIYWHGDHFPRLQ